MNSGNVVSANIGRIYLESLIERYGIMVLSIRSEIWLDCIIAG